MLRLFFIGLSCAMVSCLVAIFLNPIVVKLAYDKHLVDAPNYRKLQKVPVPVLGGMSVYLAVVVGIMLCNYFVPVNGMYLPMSALTIMFYVGLFDDLIGLSARRKFFFQILVVFLMWCFGFRVDTLLGVFGIWYIPESWSFVLSMFTGVGLMNAINLIDGVDGLASGGGIIMCSLVAIFFIRHADFVYAVFAVVFVGSLIPFFFCNVFSRKFKMFIGDSGSLMLGTVSYLFIVRCLHSAPLFPLDAYGVSCLVAIYAVPVFDTLRVMGVRILKKTSPFKADKTHLHHIFVDLGLPHFIVTTIILFMSVLIIVISYLFSLIKWHPTYQLLAVVASSALIVWGTYFVLRIIRDNHPDLFISMKARLKLRMRKPIKFYHWAQELCDGHTRRRRRNLKLKR